MTQVSEVTIQHGKQSYKTNGKGWKVLMFGTFSPACNGIPSYKYVLISEDRVPQEVKDKSCFP